MSRRTWILAGPTAAVALLLSWWFFSTPLRPWPDQGMALEAAVRHARGEGLVTSRPVLDLAREEKTQLTYFPPAYPLLVSGLLRAGLDVEVAVKGINLLALLLGVWGWCRLLLRYVADALIRGAYCGLLVLAGGALVPRGGTMDYLFWAALPLWCAALLAADERTAMGFRAALLRAGFAGGLAGALVGVRWAALFLAPAAACFWIGALLRRDRRGRYLALVLAAAAPPIVVYGLLTAVNRFLSAGRGSLLSFLEPRWDWHHLLTLYPFEAVFAIPLGLEPLLGRLWRAVDPERGALLWSLLFRLALPAAALLALGAAAARAQAFRRRAPLVRCVAATLGALLVLLAFMSVRYSWSFADWTYLGEPRYFRPVWPLAALLWLGLLDALPSGSRVRRAGLALVAVSAAYLLQAQARWAVTRLQPEESWELVKRVRALEAEPGVHVLFDNDVSDYAVAASARLRARLYPAPEEARRLEASSPVRLWLVWRPRERTAYVHDSDFDRKRFEAVRTRFGARQVWHSSSGAYELYSADVPVSP